MNLTAKEIYDLIRNKPYKDGEQMIKDYAKNKLLEYKKWYKENYEGEPILHSFFIDKFINEPEKET